MSNQEIPVPYLEDELTSALFHQIQSMHSQEISMLKGKILTLIEAIFTDPVQRKAVSDTIQNNVFYGSDGIHVQLGSRTRELLAPLYLEFKEQEGESASQVRPTWVNRYLEEYKSYPRSISPGWIEKIKNFKA